MEARHLPRVLVVDDHPDMARSLARLLHRDARVSTALSGAEALAQIAAGARFELVICDVMMPGMTGVELFDRVLATDPETARAFVFTTGGVPPNVQASLEKTGAPCLLKPCTLEQLRERLAQAPRRC